MRISTRAKSDSEKYPRPIPLWFVTMTTGIGRGYFSESDFALVEMRIAELLAANGARVLATYHCPHAPDVECDCRKPGVKLFRDAAAAHAIDLAHSWYIGDRLRDIEPAAKLGGTGILVPRRETPSADVVTAGERFVIATTLDAAVTRVLESKPLARPRDGG